MKIKTDYVPADCDYLTAGKEYPVECMDIYDDNGDLNVIHLNYSSWTIVQDEPQFTQEQARAMYAALESIRDNQALGSPLSLSISNLLAKARGEV
ncbi:MAG: hypothetical protein ACPHUL_00225 [Marinomonas gallaica]